MILSANAEIFTLLAEDYARYRPGYPAEILAELAVVCGLTPAWTVADIGAGTGNLARLFLDAGHRVIGVEPNRAMRAAGERQLAGYPAFRSLDGAAEAIPLAAESVELVAVGQALPWFDVARAKAEFVRILRPPGWVVVAWNDRLTAATAFTRAYDELTRADARSIALATGLDALFDGAAPHDAAFPHTQSFDLPGLLGRARSSGYLPPAGTPDFDGMTARLTDLFQQHRQHGQVTFHYLAQLYVGPI